MIPHRGSCAAGATILLFLLSLSFIAPPASALTLDLLVANDHNATTTANVPVTVNVLAGDSCVLNGLPCLGMKTASAGPAGHGTVVVNSDNTVTYTPTLGFVGTDS